MVDEKKVRLGLSCCMDSMKDDPFHSCPKCPYNTVDVAVQDCRRVLSREALELIETLGIYAVLNTLENSDPPVEQQPCPPPPIPSPVYVHTVAAFPMEGGGYMRHGKCPRCDARLESLDNPRFCGHCGLAVKWDEG